MCNKDFFKEVLSGSKDLMELRNVRYINVPLYDELSVVTLWPLMQEANDFMRHFPSKLPKGRLPDRCYFFNILNTSNPDYVQKLLVHANEQRNTAANEDMQDQQVEVTDAWYEKLQAVPFLSCKYRLNTNIL